MRWYLGWSCGLVLAVAACGSPTEEVDCTLVDPFPWAIIIDPVSSPSDERITDSVAGTASNATGDFPFITLVTGELASTVGTGTWDVRVEVEGFSSWSIEGVETRPGICGGFQPVELVARLVPLPVPTHLALR
jgi:hypothetical protein